MAKDRTKHPSAQPEAEKPATAVPTASSTDDSSAAPDEAAPAESPSPLTIPDVTGTAQAASPAHSAESAQALDMLGDVELDVKIELGRCHMLVGDVLRLGAGNIVELDKLAGDPVDVYVNDRHVARGEVLVVNENFCVRVNEILSVDR